MNISHNLDGNLCVLQPVGEIFKAESVTLKQYVESLLESTSVSGMVIDMQKVDAIDSAGIGVILSLRKQLSEKDTQCVLCSLTERVLQVFHFTKLLDVITVYSTLEEALSSFAQAVSSDDLQIVIDAWPTLPSAIRRGVVATIKAADNQARGDGPPHSNSAIS